MNKKICNELFVNVKLIVSENIFVNIVVLSVIEESRLILARNSS